MENTKENKLKFLAQYWGQEVAYVCYPHEEPHMWILQDYNINHTDHLLLNDIYSVKDEYIAEFGKIFLGGKTKFQTRKWLKDNHKYGDALEQEELDFLRSKGVALPWMHLSVENLVEYGWIKLK